MVKVLQLCYCFRLAMFKRGRKLIWIAQQDWLNCPERRFWLDWKCHVWMESSFTPPRPPTLAGYIISVDIYNGFENPMIERLYSSNQNQVWLNPLMESSIVSVNGLEIERNPIQYHLLKYSGWGKKWEN